MALTLDRARPYTHPLTTTCTLVDSLNPGDILWVTAPATEDVRIVSDGVTADGAALPTHYQRIPAGAMYPFEVRNDPVLIAGSTGGGAATLRRV